MNVISASYGNDSIALIQWAHEECLRDVTVVYCDTGWAAPGWDRRVKKGEKLATSYGFGTVRVQSMGMAELIRIKKGCPGNAQQFYMAYLKGIPFLKWIDEVDIKNEAIVSIGKRRAESKARAETPEFVRNSEYHGGRTIWHPLFNHSNDQRDELVKRAGIKLLPHRSQE